MPIAWPVERKNGQVILPRASWTLKRSEMRDVKEIYNPATIQNMIKLDYRRFDMFVFDVRWFKDVLDQVPQGSITIDSNGFTMIDSTRICCASEGTFILPSHSEQVSAQF
jgi:hypothetical protein